MSIGASGVHFSFIQSALFSPIVGCVWFLGEEMLRLHWFTEVAASESSHHTPGIAATKPDSLPSPSPLAGLCWPPSLIARLGCRHNWKEAGASGSTQPEGHGPKRRRAPFPGASIKFCRRTIVLPRSPALEFDQPLWNRKRAMISARPGLPVPLRITLDEPWPSPEKGRKIGTKWKNGGSVWKARVEASNDGTSPGSQPFPAGRCMKCRDEDDPSLQLRFCVEDQQAQVARQGSQGPDAFLPTPWAVRATATAYCRAPGAWCTASHRDRETAGFKNNS